MSVFNRIAGSEEPRIGIDKLLLDCIKVMDAEITVSALTYPTGFNNDMAPLSQSEVAEIGEYITAFGARISHLVAVELKSAMVTYRQTLAVDNPMYLSSVDAAAIVDKAILGARAIVRGQIEDYLLNGEHKTTTESQFRSWVGLV